MAKSYKEMTDIELLSLYRKENDLTAFKVLFSRYERLSRILASEVLEESRFDFLADFSMLFDDGIFSFMIATNNFKEENKHFKAFWKKIAYSMMKKDLRSEIDYYKKNFKQQMIADKSYDSIVTSLSYGFSDGTNGGDEILMDEIKDYLFNPKNKISTINSAMFLEYLNGANIDYLAECYKCTRRTVHRRINLIREKIIKNVLGEKI